MYLIYKFQDLSNLLKMNNEEKINKLLTILNEYVKYLKLYSEVEVNVFTKTILLCSTYKLDEFGRTVTDKLTDDEIKPTEYVMVKYKTPKLNWMVPSGFESIEFPMEDLDKRIEHYKNKLKYIKEKVA